MGKKTDKRDKPSFKRRSRYSLIRWRIGYREAVRGEAGGAWLVAVGVLCVCEGQEGWIFIDPGGDSGVR